MGYTMQLDYSLVTDVAMREKKWEYIRITVRSMNMGKLNTLKDEGS